MKRLLCFRPCLTIAACSAEVRKSLLSQKAHCGAPSVTYSLVVVAKSASIFQQLSGVCCRGSDRLNCTCTVPDACGVYPVNPHRHASMRTDAAFSSQFSRGSKETGRWDHSWWKIPLWNTIFQTTQGKQKKTSLLCLLNFTSVFHPPCYCLQGEARTVL